MFQLQALFSEDLLTEAELKSQPPLSGLKFGPLFTARICINLVTAKFNESNKKENGCQKAGHIVIVVSIQ